MIHFRRRRRQGRSGDSDSFRADFPETGSYLAGLKADDFQARREVIGKLIERYWKPVYCYLRRLGYQQADAADLTQAFFTKAIEKDAFGKADPQRGRFRGFLLTSLKNYIVDVKRQSRKKSSIPLEEGLSLNENAVEDGGFKVSESDEQACEVFHNVWINELVQRVLHRQQQEWACRNRQKHFEIFLLRKIGPALEGSRRPTLKELADRFGITPRQVANFGVTAQRAFVRMLKEEIEGFAFNREDCLAEYEDALGFLRRQRSG